MMKKQGSLHFHTISILQWLWGMWCILATFGVLFFWNISYPTFTFELLAQYDRLEKLTEFRAKFLTVERFWMLRWVGLFVALLSWSILFWHSLFEKIRFFWAIQFSFFRETLQAIGKGFEFQSAFQRYICFGLLLGFSLPSFWQIFHFPLMVDEVFSYLHFVRNGIGVTVSYYPGPNNHIFFNIQAVLWHFLVGGWFNEPAMSLRLVSWIYGLAGSFLLFAWLRRFFGLEKALWGVGLQQSLPPFFLYQFLGRGYMLQWVLILIGIWATHHIIDNKNLQKNLYCYLIWVISACLGFYTIPTFLYPFAGMSIFLGFEILKNELYPKQRKKFSQMFSHKPFIRFLMAQVSIVLGVVVLYLPIFILGSGKSLLANDWIKRLSFDAFFYQLPDYGERLLDFFAPESAGFGLVIWLAIWGRLWSLKQYSLPRLLLWVSIIPFPILFIQGVLPFERVWMYQSLVMVWGILWISELFSSKFFLRLSLSTLLVWQSMLCYNTFYRNTSQTVYQDVALNLWKTNAQKIFVNEDTYQTYIQYEYLKRQTPIEINTADFDKTNTYDYLVLSKKISSEIFALEKYQFIFENQEMTLWKRKTKN